MTTGCTCRTPGCPGLASERDGICPCCRPRPCRIGRTVTRAPLAVAVTEVVRAAVAVSTHVADPMTGLLLAGSIALGLQGQLM